MDYPLDEFLADYDTWSKPAIPVSPKDLGPKKFFGLLMAFFELRYPEKQIAVERGMAFRSVIALIWNSQPELIEAGLVGTHATGPMLISKNLLAAAYDLVIERKLESPTFADLKESMKKFEGLRDSNA